ncbi:neuroglobin-like isoform X1 [Scyliorhinus canicula]|uniref:neuroglobin-like isoform X1 n=1 Tax=Scyliorhinus canicula TaxID=7830 RepID=UPI0018F2BEDC|nr:neuroglobin-like isoform X1 [Scyliorhinus canicula]
MGCALSGTGADPGKAAPDGNPGPRTESAPDWGPGEGGPGEGVSGSHPPLPLSQEQKELVQRSWKILHQDIARVGVIMFIRLFETHPECKDVFFLFRDIDDLQQLRLSKELQSHGLRVMSFIEKSVARLEQEDKLEQLAFELGRSHCRYNAPPKYYEYVGVQFIAVVKPILKENWTPEVEEAWKVGRSSARQGPSVPFDW